MPPGAFCFFWSGASLACAIQTARNGELGWTVINVLVALHMLDTVRRNTAP
jgi:hypothetical protein